MPPLPAPVFAGFLLKAVVAQPEWLEVEGVTEICSVSECLASAPPGRIAQWTHNALGFYDTEAQARAVCGEAPERYTLFAYEVFPVLADEQTLAPAAITPAPGAVPPGYVCLGYDIVTRSTGNFFECSPLSCNQAARDFPVNAHCLLTEQAEAVAALLAMSAPGAGVEPGPYFLVKVYRCPPER